MDDYIARQKSELMESIRINYVSSTSTCWNSKTFETYTAVGDLTANEFRFDKGDGQIFKKSGVPYYLLMGYASVCIIYGVYHLASFDPAAGKDHLFNLFFALLLLMITFAKYCLRQKILWMDNNQIGSSKWHQPIAWRDIGAMYIKTTTISSDEPSTTCDLLIHHYSSRYKTYILSTVVISNLNGSVNDIVASLRFFKALQPRGPIGMDSPISTNV